MVVTRRLLLLLVSRKLYLSRLWEESSPVQLRPRSQHHWIQSKRDCRLITKKIEFVLARMNLNKAFGSDVLGGGFSVRTAVIASDVETNQTE